MGRSGQNRMIRDVSGYTNWRLISVVHKLAYWRLGHTNRASVSFAQLFVSKTMQPSCIQSLIANIPVQPHRRFSNRKPAQISWCSTLPSLPATLICHSRLNLATRSIILLLLSILLTPFSRPSFYHLRPARSLLIKKNIIVDYAPSLQLKALILYVIEEI